MPDKHPLHSNTSFVKGENPVQAFVDQAHEVTEEERNRPRYGRPPRKSVPEAPTPPKDEQAQ